MSVKLIAIHEVEHLDAAGKRAYAKPGHPFSVEEAQAANLKKIGAARDPNEAELALEALRGKSVAKPGADKGKAPAKPADDVV